MKKKAVNCKKLFHLPAKKRNQKRDSKNLYKHEAKQSINFQITMPNKNHSRKKSELLGTKFYEETMDNKKVPNDWE